MTTTTTNQTGNEAKGKGAKVENLTFPIMTGKRETITFIHPDEIKNPLAMIGKLCNDYTQKMLVFVSWPAIGKTPVFTIPAAGTYGAKERALMAHKSYLSAITEGLERDAVITNKATLETLGLYAAKGWKFTTFTKIGILTVASERLKEVTVKVALIKAITEKCPELSAIISQNKLCREVTKEVKEKGIKAGLELAQKNSFKGLPAITK